MSAEKELARIREGADDTPVDPADMPTPGQVWHRLLTDDPEKRLARLATVLANLDAEGRCFRLDHDGEIERLRGRAAALDAQIPIGEVTGDNGQEVAFFVATTDGSELHPADVQVFRDMIGHMH